MLYLKIIQKVWLIPVMVGLIPLIQNDLTLALVYLGFIFIYFLKFSKKNDFQILLIGLALMIFFETIFVKTGVETFNRNSLFGIMPLWLPILWGFSFVLMRKTLSLFG